MCAQEVMNIEEQCAEHFLLQNDRSADQIQNIFGLRVRLLQNKFKISVMGGMTASHHGVLLHRQVDVSTLTINDMVGLYYIVRRYR